MAGLSKVVAQLRVERKLLANDVARLDRAINVLKTINRTSGATPIGRSAGRVRRPLSPPPRRPIAAPPPARCAQFKRENRDQWALGRAPLLPPDSLCDGRALHFA